MTCIDVIPELTVEDVSRSIDFYCSRLGFTEAARAPEDGVPVWAEVKNQDARIMFQRRAEMFLEIPSLAGTTLGGAAVIVLQVSVDDARRFAASASGGLEVVLPVRETEYGTVEIGVKDPDGYVVLISGR
ncbi:MAG: VOC family protein [Bryobacteraceae bacterium]